MVEFGNSLDPDMEFDVLHGVLDFSVDDCLEEGEIAEDWDIGDAQCLGPIPSNILMELPMPSNEELDSSSIAGAPEQRKSGSFHTQSAISVLERSGSCSREKSLSIRSDNAIPARRSKRLRDKRINPELSTSKQTSNSRRSKQSRKRLPAAMDLMRNSPKNVDNSLNVSDRAHQTASGSCPKVVKKCAHCQSSKTTNWRGGPLGPRTLCNACGLRYKSGRLCPEYRPLLSPTFVPSQHSNSHKKVAEMRNKAKRLKVEIKTDGVPEQTQLHAKPWVTPSPTCEKTSGEETSFEMQLQNDDTSLDSSDRALLQNGSNPCPPPVKKCAHCESAKTPLWKKGPLGPSTLCNACGLRYGAGRLVPEYRPRQYQPRRHWSHADVKKNPLIDAGTPNSDNTDGASLQDASNPCPSLVKFDHDNSDGALLPNASVPYPAVIEKCTHCQSTKTLPWKEGPLGPRTLCNACGQRYLAGYLVPEYQPKPRVTSTARIEKKCCAHCESTNTPVWLKGPLGPGTLCNACGKQYKAGCLVPEYRPKASPSFVPSQHSNNSRTFLKMRAKTINDSLTADKNVGAPEQSSASCSRHKSLSIKYDDAIPARRSKRLREKGINPELSTSKQTSNSRRSKESKKRLPVSMDLMRNSPKNVDNSLNVSDRAHQTASGSCPKVVKKCAHCQSSKTTNWRGGPLGPRTLCNACGLRYKSGRLCPEYRPLLSPTFVPSQHSNSHKKVAEMRNKAKRLKVEIKTGGVPEQTRLHAKPWVPLSPTCEKTSGEETSFEMQLQNDDKSLDSSGHALLQNGSNPCPPPVKKCAHCESTKTPLWKKGPLGPSTLCNACGLRYGAGRLVPEYRPRQYQPRRHWSHADVKRCCAHCETTNTPRWIKGPLGPGTLCNACGLQYGAGQLVPEYRPNASPTFVPSQHSNNCRTFLKMRAKTINDSLTADKIAGAPEQQHVKTSTHVSLLESSPSYFEAMHVENDDKPLDSSDCASLQNGSNAAVGKKCAHCQSTITPLWRSSPLVPYALCNACGLQYQAGCLVLKYRPGATHTFVPSMHSNDRRDMKTMQSAAGIKIDEAPELANHVAASSSFIHPQIDRTPDQKQVEHMHVDTSSHVSLVESSCSYSKYGPEHVKHVGAKQCASPPSPCKKTSCEEKLSEVPVENGDDNSDGALLQNASGPCLAVIKKCTHCQSTTKTLRWRKGPLGPHTLCDACVQRDNAGRLVPEYRPKASVTSMPSQHSKDRSNIEKKMQSPASIEIAGAPEQQHVEGMQLAKHVETFTHVSLLESSPTYLKFKAKYLKHAGVKPYVPPPPPSPCKKSLSVENDDDNSDSALVQNSSDPCPSY